jgi:hypothetical protein
MRADRDLMTRLTEPDAQTCVRGDVSPRARGSDEDTHPEESAVPLSPAIIQVRERRTTYPHLAAIRS